MNTNTELTVTRYTYPLTVLSTSVFHSNSVSNSVPISALLYFSLIFFMVYTYLK